MTLRIQTLLFCAGALAAATVAAYALPLPVSRAGAARGRGSVAVAEANQFLIGGSGALVHNGSSKAKKRRGPPDRGKLTNGWVPRPQRRPRRFKRTPSQTLDAARRLLAHEPEGADASDLTRLWQLAQVRHSSDVWLAQNAALRRSHPDIERLEAVAPQLDAALDREVRRIFDTALSRLTHIDPRLQRSAAANGFAGRDRATVAVARAVSDAQGKLLANDGRTFSEALRRNYDWIVHKGDGRTHGSITIDHRKKQVLIDWTPRLSQSGAVHVQ